MCPVFYRAGRGLAKLSNKEATNYKFDALAQALKEGSFGDLAIDKVQVDSYLNIGKILSRTLADGYRKKQLSQCIEEANEPIKVLLEALQRTLVTNLAKRLETKRELSKRYYDDLLNDKEASAYEKKKIIEDYNATILGIDTRKQQILLYAKGLNTIAQGHRVLFENRNKLSTQQLREDIALYYSDIQNIISEINTLKKQN